MSHREFVDQSTALADQVVELPGAERANHSADGRGRVDQGRALRVARVAHGNRGRVQASKLHTRTLGVAALALTPDPAFALRGADPVVNVLHFSRLLTDVTPARLRQLPFTGRRGQGVRRGLRTAPVGSPYMAPRDLQD